MRAVRTILASGLLLVLVTRPAIPQQSDPAGPDDAAAAAVRFTAVDVFVDSGKTPLAAYQFDFTGRGSQVLIVGLEGGEPSAFAEPPYYDPKAMKGSRVVVAAFSTKAAAELPTGRVRVATLHLQVSGEIEPQFDVKLVTAAGPDGERIDAKISTATGDIP